MLEKTFDCLTISPRSLTSFPRTSISTQTLNLGVELIKCKIYVTAIFRNLTEPKWKLLETQLLCVNLPKNS